MPSKSTKRNSTRAQLPEELDLEQLSKYFLLNPADLVKVNECRGAVNKAGFAIQLCCLRWFGFFLPEVRSVPTAVIELVMRQLKIAEPVDLSPYPPSENTRTGHLERIREYLEFQKCDERQRLRLLNYLTDQVINLPHTTDPSVPI